MGVHFRKLVVLSGAALLCGCGEAPPAAVGGKPIDCWLQALHDGDANARKTAVFKLGNVGATDSAAFPAVLEALRDRDARVRREAIVALMKFGERAREAVAALREMRYRESDARVRRYAERALQRLMEARND